MQRLSFFRRGGQYRSYNVAQPEGLESGKKIAALNSRRNRTMNKIVIGLLLAGGFAIAQDQIAPQNQAPAQDLAPAQDQVPAQAESPNPQRLSLRIRQPPRTTPFPNTT